MDKPLWKVLSEFLASKPMSYQEAAEACDVDPSTLNRIVTQRRKNAFHQQARIQRALVSLLGEEHRPIIIKPVQDDDESSVQFSGANVPGPVTNRRRAGRKKKSPA